MEPEPALTFKGDDGAFQGLTPHNKPEKQPLLILKQTGGGLVSLLRALILLCFLGVEIYGIYVLASISPTTEICLVEIIVIAQVFSAVVVPAVIYFVLHTVQRKSWDLWCVRCVMLLFWSLFIASAAVISDKAADACASGMNFSVVAFMVVDAVIGAWATFGWLTADWT
jgi:hypothetical protein